MSRIKIQLPKSYQFTASVAVRITDLNYGGHVGNDSILAILHEGRLQFLRQYGYGELEFGGVGLIMSDAGIEFKGESFYGDVLAVQMAITEWHKYGFDLVYRVQNQDGKEIVRAKTTMLCLNYDTRKLVSVPEEAKARFETNTAGNL